MGFDLKWTRRSFMGILGAITGAALNPKGTLSFPGAAKADGVKIAGFGSTGNVYEELGVTTVMSCRWPEVSHGSLVM